MFLQNDSNYIMHTFSETNRKFYLNSDSDLVLVESIIATDIFLEDVYETVDR